MKKNIKIINNIKQLNLINKTWRFVKHSHKVLQFKQAQNTKLSDKDIISIFMGIIKMIREDERNNILSKLNHSITSKPDYDM